MTDQAKNTPQKDTEEQTDTNDNRFAWKPEDVTVHKHGDTGANKDEDDRC
jgi:hypothetical protein